MSIWSRLGAFLRGTGEAVEELPARHERREEGRERHRLTGESAWTDGDRHANPGEREVQDVAAGTPGGFGSQRTIGDD